MRTRTVPRIAPLLLAGAFLACETGSDPVGLASDALDTDAVSDAGTTSPGATPSGTTIRSTPSRPTTPTRPVTRPASPNPTRPGVRPAPSRPVPDRPDPPDGLENGQFVDMIHGQFNGRALLARSVSITTTSPRPLHVQGLLQEFNRPRRWIQVLGVRFRLAREVRVDPRFDEALESGKRFYVRLGFDLSADHRPLVDSIDVVPEGPSVIEGGIVQNLMSPPRSFTVAGIHVVLGPSTTVTIE